MKKIHQFTLLAGLLIHHPKTQQYLDGCQYNEEQLGQDHKLACLVHMKCDEVVQKQSHLETSTHKGNCCGKAMVNITQPKLPRLFESQVDLYRNTDS